MKKNLVVQQIFYTVDNFIEIVSNRNRAQLDQRTHMWKVTRQAWYTAVFALYIFENLSLFFDSSSRLVSNLSVARKNPRDCIDGEYSELRPPNPVDVPADRAV